METNSAGSGQIPILLEGVIRLPDMNADETKFRIPQSPDTSLSLYTENREDAQDEQPFIDNSLVETPAVEVKPRLVSLDAFRGFTIALMLLVNNTAVDTATPLQLTHAPWNRGIHLADLVFPWFLFCVGLAIPFSAASARRKKMPTWRYDIKILTRAVVLVALGCLIDSSLLKRPVFTLGVLQIIGLAYLVGALLYDLPMSRRLVVAMLLLLGYWAAIMFLPIPGVGSGVFEENRNLIRHINLTYLAGFNLAGLTSTAPTSALVLLGTLIGDALRRRDRDHTWKLARLTLLGVSFMTLGFIWNLHLPFNKPLWTPSYILFSAGTGALMMALFYLMIDANNRRAWAYPLVVFGSNAIVAYVAPILVKVLILQQWTIPVASGKHVVLLDRILNVFTSHAGRIPGGWLYTATYIVVWWLVLWQLYRKQLFIRV